MKVFSGIFRQPCLFKDLDNGDAFMYLNTICIKTISDKEFRKVEEGKELIPFAVSLTRGTAIYDISPDAKVLPVEVEVVLARNMDGKQ